METDFSSIPQPTLSVGQAVSKVLSKYAVFTGRARRSEYWWFCLFCALVLLLAILLDNLLGITFSSFYGPFYYISALALLLPGWAVTFRRLHDIGKSGWNILWNLIPVIGAILLIVWCCEDSLPTENKYGISPKYQG